MEGPQIPGYYPSATGDRPVPDGPGKGPTHVYGEVWRYGPKQARKTYLIRVLLGLGLPDVECVWTGPKRPVTSRDEIGALLTVCMREAQAEAARLNALDPQARGGNTRGARSP